MPSVYTNIYVIYIYTCVYAHVYVTYDLTCMVMSHVVYWGRLPHIQIHMRYMCRHIYTHVYMHMYTWYILRRRSRAARMVTMTLWRTVGWACFPCDMSHSYVTCLIHMWHVHMWHVPHSYWRCSKVARMVTITPLLYGNNDAFFKDSFRWFCHLWEICTYCARNATRGGWGSATRRDARLRMQWRMMNEWKKTGKEEESVLSWHDLTLSIQLNLSQGRIRFCLYFE